MIIRQLRQVSGRVQVTSWSETLITRHVHLSEVDKNLTAPRLTNRRVLLKTTDSSTQGRSYLQKPYPITRGAIRTSKWYDSFLTNGNSAQNHKRRNKEYDNKEILTLHIPDANHLCRKVFLQLLELSLLLPRSFETLPKLLKVWEVASTLSRSSRKTPGGNLGNFRYICADQILRLLVEHRMDVHFMRR